MPFCGKGAVRSTDSPVNERAAHIAVLRPSTEPGNVSARAPNAIAKAASKPNAHAREATEAPLIGSMIAPS